MIIGLLISTNSNAQVSAYVLNQLQITPAFTPLPASPTSTNLFATTGNIDNGVSTVAIPFAFQFSGGSYSSVNISMNGFVTFGTAPALTEVTPISSAVGYSGVISPFGCDLDLAPASTTLNVSYYSLGAVGSRIFKIQWNVKRSNNLGTAAAVDSNNMTFQLWFYETTNVIEMHYNTFVPNTTSNLSGQIGLRGSSNIDVNNLSYTNAGAPWPALPSTMTQNILAANNAFNVITRGTSATTSASVASTSNRLFRWTPVTCFPPSGLNATALTFNSATINWNAASPAPTNGYEYYIGTSATPSVTGTVGAGVLTANSAVLSSGQLYYYAVRSVCSGSDTSAWSAVSSFTTYCNPVGVPYSENFDGGSVAVPAVTPWHGNLPTCTAQQNVGTGNTWVTTNEGYYPDANMGFQDNILMYNPQSPSTANPADAWFYTRGINLTAGTTYRLSYIYSGTDTPSTILNRLKVAYGSSPLAASMTTILDNNPSIKGGPFDNVINFVAPSTGVFYFGYNVYSIANQGRLFVDDIQVVLSVCLKSTAVSVANITGTSALLSWTAPSPAPLSGYAYYYNSTGTPPTNATAPNGTVGPGVTSLSLSGLTGSSNYFFWVRTSCGGADYGEWVALNNAGTGFFTTLFVPSYCTPSSVSAATYITNVTTTGAVANLNNTTGFSAGGYGNYSSQIVSQSPGSSLNFSVGFIATGGVGVAIWVDWDNNGTFTTAERVYNSAAYLSVSPTTGTINVPGGQPLGDVRMRVVADYWATSPDPCVLSPSGTRGEVEDYTFRVVTPPPALTLNIYSDTVCANTDSATVLITSPLSNYNTYAWSPNIGFTGNSISGYVFIRPGTVTYTLTATQTVAPFSTKSITFTYNANPLPTPITISPASPTVCPSGPGVLLTATGGQVSGFPILSENFNTGAPGWTSTNTSTGGTTTAPAWGIQNSGFNPGGTTGITSVVSNDSSQFYISNSDAQGSAGTTNVELISPVFSLSGYTAASLSFYHYLKLFNYTNNPFGKILISTDGGGTYPTTLQSYTNTTTGQVFPSTTLSTPTNFLNTIIDLTAYVGQTNLRIKFQYYDKWGYIWAIDNFLVSGTATSAVKWNTQTSPVANGTAVPGLFTNPASTIPYIAGNGVASVYVLTNVNTTYTASASTPAPVCATVSTVPVSVVVVAGGTVNSNQTICSGSPSNLTLTGYTGTITGWQWSSTSTFASFTSIASSASPTLTSAQMGVLTSDRYYRVVVSNGSCSVFSTVVKITYNVTTWDGVSWTNGTPNSTTAAIFDADYDSNNLVSPGNLSACSVFISSGDVTFFSGVTLLSQNNVNTTGGTLTFENNASLVQVNNAATNTGNISYKRNTTPVRKFDYTYWSSPVAPQTLVALSPLTLSDKYFTFDPSINNWVGLNSNTLMNPGKGYVIRAPNNYSTTVPTVFNGLFYGIPNNGTISTPIVVGAGDVNLIGNPYPSALNINLFFDLNGITTGSGVIDKTIYLWTHNTDITANNYTNSDYAVYNYMGGVGTTAAPGTNNAVPNGFVASGQGFFIKGLLNGNAVFNNSMRVSGSNNQFYKNSSNNAVVSNKDRLWLELFNSQGAYKQTLVGYASGATNAFDSGYDSDYVDGGSGLSFYSLLNPKKLAIQGRGLPFNENDLIPLGYAATTAGSYQIKLSNLDGAFENQKVYLEDKLLNVIHNLKDSNYSFTTNTGSFDTRFQLRFTSSALSNNTNLFNDESVVVYKENQNIHIAASNTIMNDVKIYDIRGALLYAKSNINSEELIISNLNSSQQVLLITIKSTDGKEIVKKIIF